MHCSKQMIPIEHGRVIEKVLKNNAKQINNDNNKCNNKNNNNKHNNNNHDKNIQFT